jgi:hypothetical protein
VRIARKEKGYAKFPIVFRWGDKLFFSKRNPFPSFLALTAGPPKDAEDERNMTCVKEKSS